MEYIRGEAREQTTELPNIPYALFLQAHARFFDSATLVLQILAAPWLVVAISVKSE
jgi:hypothetical protein